MEQLLTPEEVSKVLQIPVKTLYRWRYHGTGPPAKKVGRHLRTRPTVSGRGSKAA
jgi:predicted site-specific integrase-resolvase